MKLNINKEYCPRRMKMRMMKDCPMSSMGAEEIIDPNVISPEKPDDIITPSLPTASAMMSVADPVQMAALLAEESTKKTIQKVEMIAKATGLQKQLEEYGIKINTAQAMKILAAVGAYSLWGWSKAYRKHILIGLAGLFAYINQEKIVGKKFI